MSRSKRPVWPFWTAPTCTGVPTAARAGVRVTAVAPGLIASSGLDHYPEAVRPMISQNVRDIPMKRMGTEAEVSAAIVFLLSPAAAFISGESIRIDGGGSLWRKTWEVPEHGNGPEGYAGYLEPS